MYSPPDDSNDETRMRLAHREAATALGVKATGPTVWGWRGRSLGRRAHHLDHGTCWLRVVSAPVDKAGGKLWEGTAAAATTFRSVRRPALHAVRDHTAGGLVYRAELTGYIDAPVCSPDPVLRCRPAGLGEVWWQALADDLETIAATPTERTAMRQQWIDRAVPQFVGLPAPAITSWSTVHGDLHWANLTAPNLCILDWEGFGRAPTGYDQAILLAYSLPQPETAAEVRRRFAAVLNTEAGRAAQLIVAAELLQSASRGDHPDLVPLLRAQVREVYGEVE